MKKTIFDLDITGRISILGDNFLKYAHKHYVIAVLMRLGFDVAISRSSSSPYDLLITAYENGVNSTRQLLKTKVRNCAKSINFANSTERGKRIHQSRAKDYEYDGEHNDLIIGVKKNTLDIYLVPTRFLKHFGKSKSLNQLDSLRNNWEILLNWREEYLEKVLATISTYHHL